MTRRELARKIAKQFNLTIAESDRIIKYMLTEMIRELNRGGRIDLHGFGTFYTTVLRSVVYRHPRTGRALKIPARRRAVFRQSKNLFQ